MTQINKYLIILIVLAGAASIIAFKSGVLAISQVEIEAKDLSCVDSEKVKEFLGLSGQNFFADFSKVEGRIKTKFTCVKSARVEKIFPTSIKLTLTPRQPFVQLVASPSAKDKKESRIIDEEGVAFEISEPPVNVPKVYVPKEDFPREGLIKILQKVKAYKLDISEAIIINDDLNILGRPKIIFRLNDTIDIQIASLQLILNEAKIDLRNLEFIDLRFDKPVVKFAPK